MPEIDARRLPAQRALGGGANVEEARLKTLSKSLRSGAAALDGELTVLMRRYADRNLSTTYERELQVVVEPVKARFSTWYELFPRSAGPAGKHGTFKDVERLLP